MQKSKYAKVKRIHAMLENMDNYRCYLSDRVWIFESFGQDLAGEKFFTLQVHHPVSPMETQMAAHLVTVSLMVMSPSLSIPAWSVGLT